MAKPARVKVDVIEDAWGTQVTVYLNRENKLFEGKVDNYELYATNYNECVAKIRNALHTLQEVKWEPLIVMTQAPRTKSARTVNLTIRALCLEIGKLGNHYVHRNIGDTSLSGEFYGSVHPRDQCDQKCTVIPYSEEAWAGVLAFLEKLNNNINTSLEVLEVLGLDEERVSFFVGLQAS